MMIPGTTNAEYMDIIEAGIYIGIVKEIKGDPNPARTLKRQLNRIYQMVNRGTIPHTKKGKRLYFSKTELDAWMRQGSRNSCRPTSQAVQQLLPPM